MIGASARIERAQVLAWLRAMIRDVQRAPVAASFEDGLDFVAHHVERGNHWLGPGDAEKLATWKPSDTDQRSARPFETKSK